ncbi:PHD finger protein 20 [Naviculisporaceae sp. PSN 640]
MSGDQLASRFALPKIVKKFFPLTCTNLSLDSFGDPNAQPPTPKQTPTSSIFPSSVFETPKNTQGRFDESGNWTPRFAEDYSVFNATPGNLRGTQGPFTEFVPASPFTPNSKRPLSTEGLAAEIASHANHFSPNPRLLPPVEPSRQLGSSPSPLLKTPTSSSSVANTESSSPTVERSTKKARRNTASQENQGQTATPPPTARKGERKLAPKLDTGAMQNDHGFGQPDFMGTPRQPGMGNFVTTPSDMFGYPMSAPATAAGFTPQRPFWDDSNMAGMDIDFNTNGNNVFPAQNQGQGSMEAVEWRPNEAFQGAGVLGGQTQDGVSSSELERTFVSQAPLQGLVTSAMEQTMFVSNFPTPIDDPFGITNGGGVNPGLLFSRPQSSNLDATFNTSIQMQDATGFPVSQEGQQFPSELPAPAELRRSASTKDVSPGKKAQAPATSPVKPSASRPGLSRSFSENRGKKLVGRSTLPTLAPAPRPQSQLTANAGVNANRPVVSQPMRPSGRSSPLKNHNHHRLSSLSSIPETLGPRTRTEAKFTIDANGRARVETMIVVEDDGPPTVRKRQPAVGIHNRQWTSTDDDDSSSTDDEPIIIPSRNTSFALPDPRKPTTTHPFHNPQRSISEHSTTSHRSLLGGSQDDYDSDRETLLNDVTPTGNKPSGDAASELRKLREKRPRRLSPSKRRHSHHFASGSQGPSTSAGFAGHYPGHNTTSPTTLTDTSLSTPSSSDSRNQRIRCVCNRPEVDRGNDFLVQCNSCEMQLHGRCVNMTERDSASMYICAFCADTPNARQRMRVGGSSRNTGRRMAGAGGPPTTLTSPLAHKSGFKYFR